MRWLRNLLGRGQPAQADRGIYRTVRCARCGSTVSLRIDAHNDLSLNDDCTEYVVRKVVVDDRCFSRIELVMTFDLHRQPKTSTVQGGALVQEEA